MALTKSFFGGISPAARINTFIRALITIVILCSSLLLQGDTLGFVGICDAGSNSELLLTAERKRYTFSGACGGKWVDGAGKEGKCLKHLRAVCWKTVRSGRDAIVCDCEGSHQCPKRK
jgi:hypothetical protein